MIIKNGLMIMNGIDENKLIIINGQPSNKQDLHFLLDYCKQGNDTIKGWTESKKMVEVITL